MPITQPRARPGRLSRRRPSAPRSTRRSRYMGLEPGKPLLGQPVDVVFIGCAPTRASRDLRAGGRRAATGRKVRQRRARAGGARLAGGQEQAEAEGLDRVFKEAGAEWREAGCSMCIAMNGDQLEPGPVRGEHQQPQLRGPPGQGRAHLPGLPADRRGRRGHRPDHRRADARRSEPRWHASRRSPRARFALPADDIDTDQIIPARFLKATDKDGLGRAPVRRLALRRRRRAQRRLRAQPAGSQGAQILLAGDNFGCGSSREHAPWALAGLGLPGGDLHLVRRHLPQQRAQERPAAGRGGRRRRTRLLFDLLDEAPERASSRSTWSADADAARRPAR